MRTPITVKFSGQMAEQHKLPAYEAAQSLYGLSRSILIITNYLDEGRVRHRRFENIGFEFNLVTQRAGSFETLYELITNPAAMKVAYDLSVGVAATFIENFISSMILRAVGGVAHQSIEELEATKQLNTGDTGALVDAIDPALREAHKLIDRGAGNIFIICGDNNNVNLNNSTKEYINTTEYDESISIKLFSVANFDANSSSGRAYDLEEHKTVPFTLDSDDDEKSVEALLKSYNSYVRARRLGHKLNSAVAFKYNAIRSSDGRTKKINVSMVREDLTAL